MFLAAGFESSEESQHVHEITEKITHFVIETDTDTSSFPTDTGRHWMREVKDRHWLREVKDRHWLREVKDMH